MKLRLLFMLSLVVFALLSWRFIEKDPISETSETGTLEIRMRNIGHQLLLKAGDSSSRVLPVNKLSSNEYQIQFESQMTFDPDMLVNVVHANMDGLKIESSYMVHVMSCATSEIVYGFEIYGEKDRDVIPCLGRTLPRSCYEIRVSFQAPSVAAGEYAYLLGSFLFSAFLAFLVLTKKPMVADPLNGAKSKFIQIGKILFYYEKQLLKHGQAAIPLTSKENQVLNIFASNLNQIVSRDLLQKEVWENEGVLVGRSLDVFISKLRKKLEADPSTRIVNIHGKGYKLEVD